MQDPLVEHYIAELLDQWLQQLAKKFPMAPLNSIISNYLYFSDYGNEVTRLRVTAHKMHQLIKQFQALPDELAYGSAEYTMEGAQEDNRVIMTSLGELHYTPTEVKENT